MKPILNFIFYLIATNAIGQTVFEGRIFDGDSKAALSNVNIYNPKTNLGTYTDKNGNFKIAYNQFDTIYFSMIGYDELKIIPNNLISNQFYLKRKLVIGEEIIIKPKIFLKEIKLGNIKRKERISVTPLMEKEIFGIIVKEEKKNRDLYISGLEVAFDNDKYRETNQLIKLHLYSLTDSSTLYENLLPNNYFYQLPNEQIRSLKIDFSSLNIPYPDFGFFIGIENLSPIQYSNHTRGLLLSLRKQQWTINKQVYIQLHLNRFIINRGMEPQFLITLKENKK